MKLDRQRLKTLLILLGIGLAYYLETQTLGFTLKCPLFELTGLRCPACGLTRACIGILQGRFVQAAAYNWGFTLSLPVLLPWAGVMVFRWLCRKPTNGRVFKTISILLIVWYLLWGISRNFMGL